MRNPVPREPGENHLTDPSPATDAASSVRAPAHRRGGIGTLRGRSRTGWLVTASVATFALMEGAVALGATTAVSSPMVAPAPSTATPTPTDRPRPMSTIEQSASPLRTCSVASLLGDSRFGTLQAQVLRDDGQVLFERDADTASQTARSMKVLTAAAALNVLGPDFRASTRVGSQRGDDPVGRAGAAFVDGSTLAFAIFAIFATGQVGENARTTIDTLATAFYRGGDNRSNT
ncbi:D-alanyl-D-alanine carboxypeptidase [Mycetocola sp.]|uniref:D-alanyl-D-alanine carboxypeptidase n=1 Tax=Mycetocola sp. TaxID=1871042 RepID=UPI00398A2C0B